MNDTYVQNPNILNDEVRNVAAAGAALIIGGDPSSPELAQDFLTDIYDNDPAQFTEFMDRASNGSYYFSQEGLETAQRLGHGLPFDAAEFASPMRLHKWLAPLAPPVLILLIRPLLRWHWS